MRLSIIISCAIFLVNCNTKENKATQSSAATQDLILDSTEIVNNKIEVLTTATEHDSTYKYFEIYLRKRAKKNPALSINDFLSMELPSEDDLLKNQQKYTDSLPIYPDEFYCLLLDNFTPSPNIDSIFFDSENSTVIGFQHSFQNNLVYKYHELESGSEIECTIPTKNDSLIRRFFSRLYGEAESQFWDSDTTYGPMDGEAGCYINLKKGSKSTIVLIYCGC